MKTCQNIVSYKRIQLGATRLEILDPACLKYFLDKSWVHLGESRSEKFTIKRFFSILKAFGMRPIIRAYNNLRNNVIKPSKKGGSKAAIIEAMYDKTEFKEFFYNKGDKLPFETASVDFVYSEHFFEHLFFDEASDLFRELHRVLKTGGVVRTVVPDSDFKTYRPPEPIKSRKALPWSNPDRHKTRWSIYMLGELLKLHGFKVVPVRYCDKDGKYVKTNPLDIKSEYVNCTDKDNSSDKNWHLPRQKCQDIEAWCQL